MRTGVGMSIGLCLMLAGLSMASVTLAQDKPAAQPQSNPVGSGWGTKVEPTPNSAGHSFSPGQVAAVQKVSNYFNTLELLQARFVQTDPDNKVTKGRLYIKQPGRFRFEYAKPSRKIIVSDGRFLAIQDLDLGNEDTFELDSTPFKVLLRKDVDLLRDARVTSIDETDQQVTLTISDKDPDKAGSLTVTVRTEPEAALASWVTIDAQGLKTMVEVSDVTTPEKLDDALFRRAKLFVKGVQQPN